MSDRYFFKRVTKQQWLGLRMPAALHIDVISDGGVAVQSDAFDPNSELPTWVAQARTLVLRPVDASLGPVLVPVASGLGQPVPFAQSIALLNGMATTAATDLAEAMKKAADDKLFPLRIYQAYRDFPTFPDQEPLPDEAVCAALITAIGGSARKQPMEMYSELLFVVEQSEEQAIPKVPEVDNGGAPHQLRLLARQSAAGVSLQLELDGERLTNASIGAAILDGEITPGALTPFYRWRRSLGVAERPSMESGAVQIPLAPPIPETETAAITAWRQRPFRCVDRMTADQLDGELLNYDLQLCNVHGRCTHRGRVMLKRQRLDQPAPPLQVRATVLSPATGEDAAQCAVRFRIAKGEPAPATLLAVVYRQDFPVVPTGFYGDDDDAALTVARSLSDPSLGDIAGAHGAEDPLFDGETLPNLSNHNLEEIDAFTATIVNVSSDVAASADAEEGPQYGVAFSLTLMPGAATRLFVALRRQVEAPGQFETGLASPESTVALADHMTGATSDTVRSVPHFERFWDDLPEQRWLDEEARVMVIEDDATEPARIRIVVQHALAGLGQIGGYRLWMRDPVTVGEPTPFLLLALIQAVPPLVKAYAPLELGRQWRLRVMNEAPADKTVTPLQAPDFVALAGPPPSKDEAAASPINPQDAIKALGELAAANQALQLKRSSASASAAELKLLETEAALKLIVVLHKLRAIGCAREVAMSVTMRRSMLQAPTTLPGNWILFRDQHGQLLGRAIQFWLPDGVPEIDVPHAGYYLTEVPSLHDTVAVDDFGRIAWTWEGLTDRWRHELEWLIEAVPRYAPIQGQRATLQASTADEAALQGVPFDRRHRLVVQRRAPFDVQFGLTQVLDAVDDAFVIALDAPPAFRLALHNAVARTRQGVLRMHPGPAQKTFIFSDCYTGENVAALLPAWLDTPANADARPVTMAFDTAHRGVFGQLVYDEPPCFELRTLVGASADDMHSPTAAASGPLRRSRVKANTAVIKAEQVRVKQADGALTISIPLARLDWSYTGASSPRVGDFGLGPAFDAFNDQALLRLPDPEAEMLLLLQSGDEAPRLVGHFRGSKLNGPWPQRADWQAIAGLAWGAMQCRNPIQATLPGYLLVTMTNEGSAPTVLVRWRTAGLPFTEMKGVRDE